MLGTIGAIVVTGALAVDLAGRRAQFVDAIRAAPIGILLLAVLLQLVALIARTEAWHQCVRATGASVGRRRLFRAAGVGCVASVLNGSFGVATRITSLRRTAPHDSPCVTALLAAAIAAVLGLRQLSDRRHLGLWSGLAVMHERRGRMIASVVLARRARASHTRRKPRVRERGHGGIASAGDCVGVAVAISSRLSTLLWRTSPKSEKSRAFRAHRDPSRVWRSCVLPVLPTSLPGEHPA